jgi:electron transport complex protein RnfG
MSDKKNSILAASVKMVFVLFLISAVTAGVVATVNAFTKDKIAENLENEIRSSFAVMFGEGVEYKTLGEIPAGLETVYEITAAGNTYYCANLNSSGFGGDINILASFDTEGKIVGVSVVSHSETPGLGSRVMDSSYTSKFAGKDSAGSVDSITGATISSNALKNGIKNAQKILADNGFIKLTSGGEG